MKLKISIALLALMTVAFIAVAPAAAEVTTVSTGGVVFVGEEGLTFLDNTGTPIGAGVTLEWFAAGDDPATATASATYLTQGAVAGGEVIAPSTFKTRTGNWYVVDRTVTPVTYYSVINVKMPSIDVKVFTTGTTNDMSDGRVVKDGTQLSFRLDSNLYEGILSRPNRAAGDATGIKVVVVDGEGTTYTALVDSITPAGTTKLTNLVPTSSQFYLVGSAGSGSLVPNWDLDSDQYKAGVYTFYAQVNLNGAKDNVGTVTGVTKSAVKTLEVGKDDVKIESSKDTVVRNNDFAVTITGRPNVDYVLWVKGTSNVGGVGVLENVPFIKANQNGVADATSAKDALAAAYRFTGTASLTPNVGTDVCQGIAPENGQYYAMVTLSDSGTRTVGFGTDEDTKDQTYTIRTDFYQDPVSVITGAPVAFSAKYDTVKVKVEKGDVTVTASGDSSYYIGEEIVISGTNTDSDDTWLFITGPNLAANGAPITAPENEVVTGGSIVDRTGTFVSTWDPESVETDDTWEYKWSTGGVNLDAGSYTIYAVTTPTGRNQLGSNDAISATVSVVIRQPFVTATTSSPTVAKGDDLYITGNAEGDPTPGVAIWILGKNFVDIQTETVEDNGAFEYKFSRTDSLAPGQYFVVVQHPMENNKFDVKTRAADTVVYRDILGVQRDLFVIAGPDSLQGSNAATALVNAMDSPDIDDTYYKLTFMVEEPVIQIDTIGDRYVGETFSITGTTNLAVGDQLIVDVASSSFKPAEKTQASAFSGKSGTVLITAGDKDGTNVWEFEVDASTYIPDEYIVTVDGVEASQTATQTFNVLKAVPTTKATETPVKTPVPSTATPVATTEPTPEEAAPGFGVLVSLIGLGAVAALIARKD